MTVVVSDVLAEDSNQVELGEDEHVIEALTANASDPALGMPVGLRCLDRRQHDLDLLGCEHLVEES